MLVMYLCVRVSMLVMYLCGKVSILSLSTILIFAL